MRRQLALWGLPVLVGLITVLVFAGRETLVGILLVQAEGAEFLAPTLQYALLWLMGGSLSTVIVQMYIRVSRL